MIEQIMNHIRENGVEIYLNGTDLRILLWDSGYLSYEQSPKVFRTTVQQALREEIPVNLAIGCQEYYLSDGYLSVYRGFKTHSVEKIEAYRVGYETKMIRFFACNEWISTWEKRHIHAIDLLVEMLGLSDKIQILPLELTRVVIEGNEVCLHSRDWCYHEVLSYSKGRTRRRFFKGLGKFRLEASRKYAWKVTSKRYPSEGYMIMYFSSWQQARRYGRIFYSSVKRCKERDIN